MLNRHRAVILLVKMLIWTPFLQLMCNFSFCINPWQYLLKEIWRIYQSRVHWPADTNLNLIRSIYSNSFLAIESPAFFFYFGQFKVAQKVEGIVLYRELL